VGFLEAFQGLPYAGNADFAQGDRSASHVTVVTQAGRAFPAAGLPLPFAPSSIRWAGTPTNTVDGGGGPNRSTDRTLEPLAAPWGEAGDVSTRKQSPAGQPLQPEPDS
jgi:hypothetical protein